MRTRTGIAVGLAALVFPSICVALTPTVTAAVDNPLRPTVNGKTNLPDGTELLLTLSRKESRFEAQTKVTVAKGAFRSEQFSQKGADLNPGNYTLEIIMPVSQVQSGEVRKVIGMDGEKLSGPLVKSGALGKVVRYVTTFSAGRASSAEADRAARAREQTDRDRWVDQSCHDIVQRSAPGATLPARRAAMSKCVNEIKGKKPN